MNFWNRIKSAIATPILRFLVTNDSERSTAPRGMVTDVKRVFDRMIARQISESRLNRDAHTRLNVRINSLKRELEETGIALRQLIDDTGGGSWTTAQGHRRVIGMLSTLHIRNILAGSWGSSEQRELLRSELQRRTSNVKHEYEERARKESRDQKIQEHKTTPCKRHFGKTDLTPHSYLQAELDSCNSPYPATRFRSKRVLRIRQLRAQMERMREEIRQLKREIEDCQ